MFRRKNATRSTPPAPQPAEVFNGLRDQVLGLDPATVGLGPTPELPHVWGALLETGYDHGTATLVSLADGTTSLYTSSGFGIIGGGAHENVVAATRAFLQAVERELDGFGREEDSAVPDAGGVVMRALTYDGPRAVRAAEEELGRGRHPQSEVFLAGHAVITQLRLLEQARPS